MSISSDALAAALATAPPEVAAAWLFGSQARGDARTDSDVDVAVLLANEPSPSLQGLGVGLADTLSEHIGRQVDLVVVNRAPADLVHRVLRDGKLLLDRNKAQRIRFEVRNRNEYFDLLPYLEEYRRQAVRA